jgi:hypothetical protein
MVKAIIALTLAIAAFASAAIGPPQGDEDRRLLQLMVGEWQSPRHTYLYRSDGTWTILPERIDSYQATNGRWRTETAV